MGTRISIQLQEDSEGDSNANVTTKEWYTGEDALYLPDVLRIMTEALRGHGYVIKDDEGLIVGKRED